MLEHESGKLVTDSDDLERPAAAARAERAANGGRKPPPGARGAAREPGDGGGEHSFMSPKVLHNLLTMTGANEREIVHPDLAAWLHTSGLRLENRGQALPDRLIVPPAARLHACFWDDVKRHPEDFGENMHVEHCYSLRPHAAVTDALLFSPRVRNAMSASPYCAALMRAPVVEHASNLSWEAYGRAGTVVLLYIQIVYAPRARRRRG